jgi:hypothetical protein
MTSIRHNSQCAARRIGSLFEANSTLRYLDKRVRDEANAKKEAREALERATRERTAAQFVTFFGTLLGGLGGGLAAWLQRIFENPQSPLNVFRWCLMWALACVAAGLACLALVVLLDRCSARELQRQARIDRCSLGFSFATWGCLVLALGFLAVGAYDAVYRGAGLAGKAYDTTSGTGTLTAPPK